MFFVEYVIMIFVFDKIVNIFLVVVCMGVIFDNDIIEFFEEMMDGDWGFWKEEIENVEKVVLKVGR